MLIEKRLEGMVSLEEVPMPPELPWVIAAIIVGVVILCVILLKDIKKVYLTCTFEGLGGRKDEFVEKIIQAMESRGLKRIPPIEPLGIKFTLADAFNLFDQRALEEIARGLVKGADIYLGLDEEKVIQRMGFRSQVKGENLRFGYFYGKSVRRTVTNIFKSVFVQILPILLSAIWTIFMLLFVIGKSFILAHGVVGLAILVVTLLASPMIPYHYWWVKKQMKPVREVGQQIVEIARSMGGKQITPFKKTTVKLED